MGVLLSRDGASRDSPDVFGVQKALEPSLSACGLNAALCFISEGA